jgi:hypothetical protein
VYEGDIAKDYTDVCLHIKNPGPPDIVAPDCPSDDQQFNPDSNKCEGTTTVPATATQECDTGKLNKDSGMCEVRPGRGNR